MTQARSPVNAEDGLVETGNLSAPTFPEALRFWIKLGFISFGGPAGQIAVMHKELVERRKWISEESFLHALNFCMLLPGPEAQQLAAYNGWRLHGIKGGIAAGAFFVIPSIFFLLILSYLYARYGHVNEIIAVLDGFKPVVVAIVVEAVIKIGRRSIKTPVHFAIAALSFIAVQFLNLPFPLIVVAALITGLLLSRNFATVESQIERSTKRPGAYALKVVAVCLGLWIVPFILVSAAFGFDNIGTRLYLFFTQAAFVTFGGAYAVLAYVNQAAVAAGWITAAQAVDGLALAETTPGPLIMVLQFIGFMTGWQNSGTVDQTTFAIVCALIVTFLPSFLFVFCGAPYIERLQGNRRLAGALAFVTSAVVGVILNLSIVFGSAVFTGAEGMNWFGIILAAAAFVALYFVKADVLLVVLAGGLMGIAKYALLG